MLDIKKTFAEFKEVCEESDVSDHDWKRIRKPYLDEIKQFKETVK